MHWGINPSQKHHPLLFSKPSSKFVNCPNPFLGNLPYTHLYWFFVKPSPSENRTFPWTSMILKFFILSPSHLLKETKFLVKISQFKFLVIKFLFINFFLLLNISDYRLFFYVKVVTPPPPPSKKISPSFRETPSKNWNIVWDSLPRLKRVGWGAHYYFPLNNSAIMVKWKCLKFLYSSKGMYFFVFLITTLKKKIFIFSIDLILFQVKAF